jgi:hypothetical protein
LSKEHYQQRFYVEPLPILDIINLGLTFRPESLGKFLFPSHAIAAGTPSPLPAPPCRHHRHRSGTPSTPPPPFWDPAPLGHHEELREPPSTKPPSPLPSGNHLHVGHHLRPSSGPDFAMTRSALAPRTFTSSVVPPSTSEPRYRHHRPPVGPRHHAEPFPVSFRFPQPSPTPPPIGPHRRQPL